MNCGHCHRDLSHIKRLGPLIVMKAIAFLSSLRTLTAFTNSVSSNSSNFCSSSRHFWYMAFSFDAFLCMALNVNAENISYNAFSNDSPMFSHALFLWPDADGAIDFRFLRCLSLTRTVESESRVPSTRWVGRLAGSDDCTVSVLLFPSSISTGTPFGNWNLPATLSPIPHITK